MFSCLRDLKPLFADGEDILAGLEKRERVLAAVVGLSFPRDLGVEVGGSDLGAGDGGAGLVGDGTGDLRARLSPSGG